MTHGGDYTRLFFYLFLCPCVTSSQDVQALQLYEQLKLSRFLPPLSFILHFTFTKHFHRSHSPPKCTFNSCDFLKQLHIFSTAIFPKNYTCLLLGFTTHHISRSKHYVFIFLNKFKHNTLKMQVLKSIPGIFYVLQGRIPPSYPTVISRKQSLAVLWTFCSILPAQLLPVSPSNTLHEEAYWLFSSQEFEKTKQH